MKRHPALQALSHDHHHALVAARRLRKAADAEGARETAIESFTAFFEEVTVPHFREEEETLFPLVIEDGEARPLVGQALLDHQQLRALVARLDGETMTATADLLERHVRLEERELFPLIEHRAAADLERRARPQQAGPVWGHASEDLNATLLSWPAGGGATEHVNDERDVLIYVVDGSVTIAVDGEEQELRAGNATIVPKRARRELRAGSHGVRYLSVHRRRPPLQIASRRD